MTTALEEIAAERRPAFPEQAMGSDGHPEAAFEGGLRRLDYFAAHAPVSYEMALAVYGSSEAPTSDTERAAFFAVWALLRREYASAMVAEIERLDRAEGQGGGA